MAIPLSSDTLLLRHRRLAASKGLFRVTGRPASTSLFRVVGRAVNLTWKRSIKVTVLPADVGGYILMGKPLILSKRKRALLAPGAFVAAGSTAALTRRVAGKILAASAGTFRVTGAPSLAKRSLIATAVRYALVGGDVHYKLDFNNLARLIQGGVGPFIWTGRAALLNKTSGGPGPYLTGSGTIGPNDKFVAPNVPYGSGNGSIGNPWNIRTPFQFGGVGAGNTCWMRGGTYSPVGDGSGLNSWWVGSGGTAGNPVVFRSYPGEWAKVNGSPTPTNIGTSPLLLQCNHITLREFEIYQGQAAVNRVTAIPGPAPGDIYFGTGIVVYQPSGPYTGQKLINLVIHDCSQGISHWPESTDAEVSGCIVYYNGWEATGDDGHGHGLYSDNWASPSGTKTFRNNVLFRNFGINSQSYNESGFTQTKYDIRRNVLFSSGVAPAYRPNRNFIMGGDGDPSWDGTTSISNNYFWDAAAPGSDFMLGYYTHVAAAPHVTNNYMPRTGVNWIGAGSESGTYITGNTLTHPEGDDFNIGSQNTFVSKPLTGTNIFVEVDPNDSGRAHVIVYNWSLNNTVSVDLSSVLSNGQTYSIYNVQNILGSPVISGTYNGSNVTLPMTTAGGLTQASPLGYAAPPVTWPEFNVFLVRRTS